MTGEIKLRDFPLIESNHFIAMEYYGLILNRTFLILITDDHLIGLKVNGMVSVEAGEEDPITASIINEKAIKGDLSNPYLYIKNEYFKKIENLNVFGEEIINEDKSNFKISRQKIKKVTYDKRKKWGMGYYPHDGKVYLKTENKRKREFIILGSQSGEEIKTWIEGSNYVD